MTTTLRTENSTYEIEQDAMRIRRVSGANEPTRNQGTDGEWRDYCRLTWCGDRLLVSYGIDEQNILRQTLLSPAQHIEGDPIPTENDHV